MTKTLATMNKDFMENRANLPDSATAGDTSTADKIAEMTMALELVTSLEKRCAALLEQPESSGRDMKIRLTDIALKRAESMFVKSVSPGDESEKLLPTLEPSEISYCFTNSGTK